MQTCFKLCQHDQRQSSCIKVYISIKTTVRLFCITVFVQNSEILARERVVDVGDLSVTVSIKHGPLLWLDYTTGVVRIDPIKGAVSNCIGR